MSTSNSVGRLTATNEKVRLTATSEKVRLTATQENGRSTATFKVGRLTATNKKDRSRLCAFTFADGRQCRTPRRSGHQHLCYYHAKKEAEALIAKQAGEDLASLFFGKYLCALISPPPSVACFPPLPAATSNPKPQSPLHFSVTP